MTLALLPYPRFRGTDANGLPLAGGLLYSYAATTDTPLALLTSDGVTSAANPVVLNAAGEAEIRLAGSAYKLVLKNSAGVEQWTMDNVVSLTPSVIDDYSATVAQMKLQTSPGALGTESQATSLAGELERLRWSLAQLGSATYWYLARSPNVLNVESYGADPAASASTNSTAIQAAFVAAAAVGGTVCLPRMYQVNSVKVVNGVRAVIGPGGLIDNGVSSQGVLCLDGPNLLAGTAVQNCRIVGLTISMVNGANRGIFVDGGTHITIQDCYLDGFTDSADKDGIRLYYSCDDVTITGNHILFSTQTPTNQQRGITAVGNGSSAGYTTSGYAGMATPTIPVQRLTIANNICTYGSHGISLNSTWYFTVTGNTLALHRDRSIIMEPLCKYGTVSGNTCTEFKSSAIHAAYGGYAITVAGNQCFTTTGNGEGVLQAYLGCKYLTFVGNQVYMEATPTYTSTFGVYIGPGCDHIVVRGNTLTGHSKAGICLDNEWVVASVSTPGTYGRGGVDSGGVNGAWAYENLEFCTIADNTLYNPNTAVFANNGAIVLHAASPTYTVNNIVITDNHIVGTTHDHYLHVEEVTSTTITGLTARGNLFTSATAAKFSFSRGKAHFTYLALNQQLDDNLTRLAFTDGDTTPSVLFGRNFVCANTGATAISTFDDGQTGDVISVRLDNNTTLTYSSGSLRLRELRDLVGTSANQIITLERIGTIWYERSKNYDSMIVLQPGAFTAANGANADCAIPSTGLVRVTGPTGAFSLNSLVGGVAGRELTLFNATAQDMTLTNDSGGTAANRLLTLTGADVTLTATSCARFIYSGNDSRWILTGTQG